MNGKFITIEGIEGSGKSTVAEELSKTLKDSGYGVILTREPGGTRVSERIRELLLNPEYKELAPLSELFLYLSARAQLVTEVIGPSLKRGMIVVCDRFMDASVAYQGWARGLGEELVEELNSIAVSGVVPDMTFLLDLPVIEGFKRGPLRRESGGVSKRDRLELEKREFHERVREGYLRIARRHTSRVVVVDATMKLEEVMSVVYDTLAEKLGVKIRR